MVEFDDLDNKSGGSDLYDTTKDDVFTVEYRHLQMFMYLFIMALCFAVVLAVLWIAGRRRARLQQSLLRKTKKAE